MKTIVLSGFIFLVVCGIAEWRNQVSTLTEAIGLRRQGDFARSRWELDRLLKEEPCWVQARAQREWGKTCCEQGLYHLWQQEFSRAAEAVKVLLDRESPQATGYEDEAREILQKTQAEHLQYALELGGAERHVEALESFAKIPYLYPDNPLTKKARHAAARCRVEHVQQLLHTHRFDAARKQLPQVVQVPHLPGETYAAAWRGVFPAVKGSVERLQREEKWEEALQVAEEAVEKDFKTAPEATMVQLVQLQGQIEKAWLEARGFDAAPLPELVSPESPEDAPGKAAISIHNHTTFPLKVTFRGPTHRQVRLKPEGGVRIIVEPGAYEIFARTDGDILPAPRPFYGQCHLRTGIYKETFIVVPRQQE